MRRSFSYPTEVATPSQTFCSGSTERPPASGTDCFLAGRAALDAPATDWENCGVWETDGSAVLLDSAVAGADLAVEYPDGGRLPEQAQISVPAGRWSVRATHKTGDFPWVGVVQLLPA
ncbi:immunity 21 family protein [Streptomyces sp. NBC_01754]|uniref:Imm21 family immunity protein n=1 Tax=Streptomyces sp. NBC_01754 TaxID=2975930 RepID=UPI002DDC810C|nr:Imm21 family immunity protein [Streptomyces sp. NBC_01754]WSC93951.1 immunity 21 family protein [Streptomyces sp. NBC_01754]